MRLRFALVAEVAFGEWLAYSGIGAIGADGRHCRLYGKFFARLEVEHKGGFAALFALPVFGAHNFAAYIPLVEGV